MGAKISNVFAALIFTDCWLWKKENYVNPYTQFMEVSVTHITLSKEQDVLMLFY